MTSHRTAALCLMLVAAPAVAQHDLHRNSARQIARGRADLSKAIASLEKNDNDIESLFLLAVAHCQLGDADLALDYARRAVEAGLPFSRLQAGPRRELARLYDSPGYQKWAEGRESSLLHGPMLGNVTADAASFWVRTADAAVVSVELSTDGGKIKTNAEPVRTTAAADFTAVASVRDLSPDTVYAYRVAIDGKFVTEAVEFRTTAAAGSAAKFRIAFGGGAGYIPMWERMWDTIAGHKPAALLMLGDNVYIDDPTHLFTQQYCYYRRQSRPEWRRLVARTAVYSIYDDHDFGTNDCVPGPAIDEPSWKREVWRTFRRNWANPAYGGGERQPGCWYDFRMGDVHFIMIDGRYYRDRRGGSMLGPVQKAWLKKTLAESRAAFKVLASDVPWTPGIKPGSRDPWDGFPEEREEIFSFIGTKKIDGVLLIAADRHRSDFRKIARAGSYDLLEFQSSRLTNRHTHGIVKTPGLIFGYNKTCSFGMIDFDTTLADPRATMTIVDIDGNSIHTLDVKLSELTSG